MVQMDIFPLDFFKKLLLRENKKKLSIFLGFQQSLYIMCMVYNHRHILKYLEDYCNCLN